MNLLPGFPRIRTLSFRLGVVLPLLAVSPAFAVVVGTAELSMDFSSTTDFTATTAFDDQTFVVLGNPVNLYNEIGSMDLAGQIFNDGISATGTFHYDAVSTPAGPLAYHAEGEFVCSGGSSLGDPSPCYSPVESNFLGDATSLAGSLVGGLLPAEDPAVGLYSVDGFVNCFGNLCSGPISLNFQEAQATAAGANVAVAAEGTFYNPATQQVESVALDVEFESVDSSGGTTLKPVSNITGDLPAQFAVEVGGYRAVLFDLLSTATFSGVVELCGDYPDVDDDGFLDGTLVPESAMRFLHNEGGVFVDRTSLLDPVANRICAEVTSFSEFAMAPAAAATCLPSPSPDCLEAGQAQLQYSEKAAGKEKMKLQWKKVATATTPADFGDPVGGDTSVTLCIYDDASDLVQQLVVDRAGQDCAGKACWKTKGTKGFGYKDKDNASAGVSKIGFASGDAGKGKADAKGRNNAARGQTSLPAGVVARLTGNTSPTIQMLTYDGLCIGATMTEVKKDDGVQYKAQRK